MGDVSAHGEDLWDQLTRLALDHQDYRREAYLFVLQGIQWSFERLGTRRHLSGEEFTKLLVAFAREQFGALAPFVFEEWGVLRSLDLGRIVYRLIDAGLMSKRESDRLEDFRQVVDLPAALADPDFEPGLGR